MSAKRLAVIASRVPLDVRDALRTHASRLNELARSNGGPRVTSSRILRDVLRAWLRRQPNDIDNFRFRKGA